MLCNTFIYDVFGLRLFDIGDVDKGFMFYRWWMGFIFVAHVMLVIYFYFTAYVMLRFKIKVNVKIL